MAGKAPTVAPQPPLKKRSMFPTSTLSFRGGASGGGTASRQNSQTLTRSFSEMPGGKAVTLPHHKVGSGGAPGSSSNRSFSMALPSTAEENSPGGGVQSSSPAGGGAGSAHPAPPRKNKTLTSIVDQAMAPVKTASQMTVRDEFGGHANLPPPQRFARPANTLTPPPAIAAVVLLIDIGGLTGAKEEERRRRQKELEEEQAARALLKAEIARLRHEYGLRQVMLEYGELQLDVEDPTEYAGPKRGHKYLTPRERWHKALARVKVRGEEKWTRWADGISPLAFRSAR